MEEAERSVRSCRNSANKFRYAKNRKMRSIQFVDCVGTIHCCYQKLYLGVIGCYLASNILTTMYVKIKSSVISVPQYLFSFCEQNFPMENTHKNYKYMLEIMFLDERQRYRTLSLVLKPSRGPVHENTLYFFINYCVIYGKELVDISLWLFSKK